MSSVAALRSAIARPHAEIAEALGAHRVRQETRVAVSSGAQKLDALKTTTELDYAETEGYRVSSMNDADYGREVVFSGERLYLKSRYGKYHGRAPQRPGEPAAMLSEILAGPSATFALLASGAAIRSSSEELVGGRSARVATLELAGGDQKPPPQKLGHRKWRETIEVSELKGSVAIDDETGALLAADIDGVIEYQRDGKSFRMTLGVDHEVSSIGEPVEVEAPGAERVVAAPRTSTELEEREKLLDGIAAPAPRNRGTP